MLRNASSASSHPDRPSRRAASPFLVVRVTRVSSRERPIARAHRFPSIRARKNRAGSSERGDSGSRSGFPAIRVFLSFSFSFLFFSRPSSPLKRRAAFRAFEKRRSHSHAPSTRESTPLCAVFFFFFCARGKKSVRTPSTGPKRGNSLELPRQVDSGGPVFTMPERCKRGETCHFSEWMRVERARFRACRTDTRPRRVYVFVHTLGEKGKPKDHVVRGVKVRASGELYNAGRMRARSS